MKIQLMKNLCHYTQNDLKKTLAAIYNNYEPIKYETIETDDYLYVRGLDECPVCLVCHLDTVFEDPYRYYTGKPIVKQEAEPRRLEWFHDTEKKVLWSPDGAGFDDRAGVYIALMLIDKGADVLFCTDEEVGCLGAKAFCRDYKEFPRKIKYFVELDRAYFQDCVFYNCTNEEFQDYVETFGFIKDKGSYSDIYFLGPHFDIACVNLSVGYFNEHEQIEIKVSGNHATLTGRSRVTAAVFGGGRHTWHLQLMFQLVKRDGQWQFTSARASTY